MGMRFIIQSERDTAYLENRIEAFLRKMEGVIHGLTAEEFNKHVESLILKKTEKLKNLNEEAQRFWAYIHSGYYEFNCVDTDVEHLRKVTKDDLLAFFMEYIHPSSRTRSKISVHLRSQAPPKVAHVVVDAAQVISCLNAHGMTTPKAEDIEAAVAGGIENLEQSVRQLMVNQDGVEEERLEALIKSVADLAAAGQPGPVVENTGVTGEEQNELPPGNVVIEDLVKFKADCALSRAPQPVVPLETMRA
ncbi:MAG: Metalloenzyme, LuxS/M16 peptidase-like protein [Olpidium bornovanus]|uniref:Metalloenzyme, LuxS/M16 peptidase-like protein n=1 Tax=Olpidium bornovanus TaxID=278681 RepID=A0A8H7ZU11_9FUNG|nr:MAG: Metalloenzyme, LuxS/M16 peptidase-like protein [Olpidium bornovanus]